MNMIFEILCYNCATIWETNEEDSREFIEAGCFRCKKDPFRIKYDTKWELFLAEYD